MKPTNPVEEQSLFIDFCQNRGLVKSSIRLYRIALQKYSDFTKMSLNELIEEAEAEEEDRVRLRNRKVKKYLMDFRSFLDSTDLSKNYKGHIIMLIRSFYNEYQIELPRTYQKKLEEIKKRKHTKTYPLWMMLKGLWNILMLHIVL
ncbi:MAG: hypothetical protein NKF70_04005 [Methanobacterium sp. ERen5]|nr:MAG: hypothetical protein NKF70_04005 [Methanobacterium sp. ERen5]